MYCPCKDCTKRWISGTSRCHSSRKEYKDWSDFNKQQNEMLAKHKAHSQSIGDILYGHRNRNK